MKYLIFLFLFISVAQAQFGISRFDSVANGTTYQYETFSSSGTNVISAINTTGFGGCDMIRYAPPATFDYLENVQIGDMFRAIIYGYTKNSGTNPGSYLTDNRNGAAAAKSNANNITASGNYDYTTTATTAIYYQIWVNTGVATNFTIDSIAFRQRLTGGIYISTSGSDAAEGTTGAPIKTIAECNKRTYYSGGVVNFSAETHTGTMTLTAAVTINGSGAIVEAIACGSNAVTLEGLDFIITTLTGTNITDNRTYTATDQHGYKKTGGYPKGGGYR